MGADANEANQTTIDRRSWGTSRTAQDSSRYTFLSNHKVTVTIRSKEYLTPFERVIGTPTVVSGRGHCPQTAHLESGVSAVSLRVETRTTFQTTGDVGDGNPTACSCRLGAWFSSPVGLHDVEVLRYTGRSTSASATFL